MRHARSYRASAQGRPRSAGWPCALLRIEEEQRCSCSPPRGHEATERANFDSPESRPSPCAPCLDQPFGRGWRAAWALDRLCASGKWGRQEAAGAVFVRRGAEACATNHDSSDAQHGNDQRHGHCLSSAMGAVPKCALQQTHNEVQFGRKRPGVHARQRAAAPSGWTACPAGARCACESADAP